MPGPYDLFTSPAGLPHTTQPADGFPDGIPYTISKIRRQWVPGANQTVAECMVRGDDADAWVECMVGRSYVESFGGGFRLRRAIPERVPASITSAVQFCTKVTQIDEGGDPAAADVVPGTRADTVSRWMVSGWHLYQVAWEALPYIASVTDDEVDADIDPDEGGAGELNRYVTRKRQGQGREVGIPGGGFFTVPAGEKIMQNGFKVVPASTLTYTWHRVPVANIPRSSIDSCLGKVNLGVFDDPANGTGFAIPAGRVLFVDWDENRFYDANGDFVADLTYHFRASAVSWNAYPTATGTFVEVSSDGTTGGTKPYTAADLTSIFAVD
jgi:hypothetical protein